jgi:hypothetical protein
VLARKPRTTVRSLAISLALGLLYLGYLRVFQWDTQVRWLPYLGLWVISVVMGGAVCINAMSFDAMRVRAALDSGEQQDRAGRARAHPLRTRLPHLLSKPHVDTDAEIRAVMARQ